MNNKKGLIISGGQLFNGVDNKLYSNVQIYIKNGIIESVNLKGDSKFDNKIYKEVKLSRDVTILPGLIDSHVHVQSSGQSSYEDDFKDTVGLMAIRAANNAKDNLMSGFTLIRDASAESLIDYSVKEAINKNIIQGPRMLISCRGLSITGGHGDHSNGWPPEISFKQRYVVDGPIEVRKATREQLKNGADWIKVATTGGILSTGDNPRHVNMRIDEVREAVIEAKNWGKKVMAHAQGEEGIKNAIIAGVHSIEHGCFLTDEIIEMMLEKDVYLIPTLCAGKLIVENGKEAGIPQKSVNKAKKVQNASFRSFEKAYKAGVKIVMGTDAGTCYNYHGNNAYELELMVDLGMSNYEAILASTKVPSEMLDMSNKVGTIEQGKYADLIAIKGNPLKNISILQQKDNLQLIVKGGEIYLLNE